jgi:hypothetical protein
MLIIGIVSISFLTLFSFGLDPFPFDTSNIYIRGNDVVKGFSLDSFDGEALTSGGTVPSLGMRFNVETGGFWIIDDDDLQVISTYTSVDETEVEIRYLVTAKNKINLYTNVRLSDATSETLNTNPESFLAGKFVYYGCFGTAPSDVLSSWESHITWVHYDFGDDWRSWNEQQNVFVGDLKASFDINPSPLPPFFTDADGNTIETIYDYIAVDAIVVSDSVHGLMSTDKPEFNKVTPEEYDQAKENDKSGGEAGGDIAGDLDYKWNPRPTLSAVVGETFDVGTLPHTKGVSLNPTTKDGRPIWDPENQYESMTDCEFTYSLKSLSPLITKYTSTLTWYEQDLEVQDFLEYIPPLAWKWIIRTNHDDESIQSETRDVGLHINNRYIQAEIAITFDIWSKFDITALKLNETQLDTPEEYYDELLWQMIVDGWGGGRSYIEPPPGADLTELLILIVIIVAIIGGIYIVMKLAAPLLMFRLGQKSR